MQVREFFFPRVVGSLLGQRGGPFLRGWPVFFVRVRWEKLFLVGCLSTSPKENAGSAVWIWDFHPRLWKETSFFNPKTCLNNWFFGSAFSWMIQQVVWGDFCAINMGSWKNAMGFSWIKLLLSCVRQGYLKSNKGRVPTGPGPTNK